MPVMDGISATTRIRTLAKSGQIKDPFIIACTAYGDKYSKEQCLNAGANRFLPKPVRFKEVTDLLIDANTEQLGLDCI